MSLNIVIVGGGNSTHVLSALASEAGHAVTILTRKPEKWNTAITCQNQDPGWLADGTVHPEITKLGVVPSPVCPCISLGIGPVSWKWAADAEYVGREHLGIEFLWIQRDVDHC